MSDKKIAMFYSKINGVEKIRIYSGEGKVHTIEGKSISEFACEREWKSSNRGSWRCKMKLTKSIEKSENYHKSLCKYLYIIYQDEGKEIFKIIIQIKNRHYKVYYGLPMQRNIKLKKLQISQLWFRSFFLTNMREVDKVINKYLEFLEMLPDKKITEIVKDVRECGTDYREEVN